MSHSDRLKSFYRKQILNGRSGFAENGTFTPSATGTSRPVRASVTVRQNETETEGTRDRLDQIEVFLIRDEADEIGGVAVLNFNDTYTRDAEYEADSTPYVFVGELLEQGRHYTRAVFQRHTNRTQNRGR